MELAVRDYVAYGIVGFARGENYSLFLGVSAYEIYFLLTQMPEIRERIVNVKKEKRLLDGKKIAYKGLVCLSISICV